MTEERMKTTQLIYGYHPGFSPSFSPTVCTDPAVSRTAWLFLCKPLRNTAGCPQACTRGMAHRGSRMRIPQFRMRMSMLIGIGTTSSFSCYACHSHPGCYCSFPQTGTTHNGIRLSNAPQVLYTPSKTSNSPCPLFTTPHSVEERHQARNGRAGHD